MCTPKLNVCRLSDKVHISPPTWPECLSDASPGTLSKFAYNFDRNYYYGEKSPFKTGIMVVPPIYECGGVIFFRNDISLKNLRSLMYILGTLPKDERISAKEYVVYVKEATDPGNEGYLTQMRVVSKYGLKYLFGALPDDEYNAFPKQKLDAVEALMAFIEQECDRWGTSFTEDGEKGLRGLFGGDGNYMREELSFGFMIEDDQYGIYRIWSRAFLIGK